MNTEITSQINLADPVAVEAFLAAQPIKYCKNCNSVQTYKITRSGRLDCRCTECETSRNTKRVSIKDTWVKIVGGKCLLCGYSRFSQNLEFHHIHMHLKKFEIGSIYNIKAGVTEEEIKEEVSKCILLCRNCHGEAHILDTPEFRIFLEETKKHVARENQSIVV